MQIVDKYENAPDLSGQIFEYILMANPERTIWAVVCWQKIPGDIPEDDQWEYMWTVNGVVTSYKDGNPNFPMHTPFTEETAREEFERWRATK